MSEKQNKPTYAEIAVKNLDNLNSKQKEIVHLPTEEEKRKIVEEDPGAQKTNVSQKEPPKILIEEFPLPERPKDLPQEQVVPLSKPHQELNKQHAESPKHTQSPKKVQTQSPKQRELPQQEQAVPLHSQKAQKELNKQNLPKQEQHKEELSRVAVPKEEQPLSEKYQSETQQQQGKVYDEQKIHPPEKEKHQPKERENKGLLEKAKETLDETWEATKEVAREFTDIIGFTGPEDTKSGPPETKLKSREIPLHKMETKVEYQEKRE